MLNKNEIVELNIESYSSQGEGIAKLNGIVIFIKGTIQGELVSAKIIKVKKNCAWAKLLKIIKPSVFRIKPDCPHSSSCGGCSLRHMSYEEELRFKLQKVNDAISKIGKIDFKIDKIHGSLKVDRYRNKAIFPVSQDKDNNIKIGLFQSRSHNVIDVDRCYIQSEQAEQVISVIRKWMEENNISAYDEETQRGKIRHIYVRTNKNSEVLVCIVANTQNLRHTDKLIEKFRKTDIKLAGLMLNVNNKNTNVALGQTYKKIFGKQKITDWLFDLSFDLYVPSFFQVNRRQAEKLYEIAINFAGIEKTDTVIDMYCGAGTISLCMAKSAKEVTGIEIVNQAIENAKQNAIINQIENVKFVCQDASDASQNLVKNNIHPDIVCVDPPRKGLDNVTLNSILEMAPKKIIYISCDCATLARDLNIFKQDNYHLSKAQAVDMFPRTPHVETVCMLTK